MTPAALIPVAPDVWQIPLLGNLINAYVVGDILIDAGIRASAKPLERALAHHKLRAHALTHAHADHQGASHRVCTQRQIPLWIHEKEAELMSQGNILKNIPNNPITALQQYVWAGPANPVERRLKAGDDVNGFEVLETPGHSLGHISLWRASDGVLIAGDVLTNVNLLTLQTTLEQPPGLFTLDAAQNRTHIRRLAKLQPKLALFGHGAPLRDPEALLRFSERL